jgi:hypothetical protein
MIYNETLSKSYGTFVELGTGSSLAKYRPSPTDSDYEKGYIDRYFAKKANENVIVEISYLDNVNINLYKKVVMRWRISGPKNNTFKNGILDKAGITEQNRFEIERVKKEEGVDLSLALPNLLEYWRGR